MNFQQIFKVAGVFDEMDVLARAQFLEGFLRVRPFAKIRGAVGKTQLLRIISAMVAEAGGTSPEWTSSSDTGLYRNVFRTLDRLLSNTPSDASDLLQSMMGLMGWEDEGGEVLELGGKSPFWLAGKYASEKNGSWLAEGMVPKNAEALAATLASRRAKDILRAEANYRRKQNENALDIADETVGGEGSESEWGMVIEALFRNPEHPTSRRFFTWLDKKIGVIMPPVMAHRMIGYLGLLRAGQVQFKGTGATGAGGGDTAAAKLLGITPQELSKAKVMFSDRLSKYLAAHPREHEAIKGLFEGSSFLRDVFSPSMHTASVRRIATAFYLRRKQASEDRGVLSRIVERFAAAKKDPLDLRDPESGKTLVEFEKEFEETLAKMYAESAAKGYSPYLSEQIKRYRKEVGGRVERLRMRIQKAQRGLRLSTNPKDLAKKPPRGDWGYEGPDDKISAIVSSEGGVVGWMVSETKRHPVMVPGKNYSSGYEIRVIHTPYTLEGKFLPGKPSEGGPSGANRALDRFSDYLKKQSVV